MDELKKCPFCGSEAEVLYSDGVDFGEAHWIRCTGCEVEQHRFYSEREAIRLWNTRHD